MTIIELARHFRHLRETEVQNRGARVMAVQLWGGADEKDIAQILLDATKPGFSWCCYLFWTITDVFFIGASPFPRTGACQEIYDFVKAKRWVLEKPAIGCGYLYVNAEGHAHHIGFVTIDEPVCGFAGNTSEDGKSSNGKGAFEHKLEVSPSSIVYFDIPGGMA
jgi:hypothetical protein